MPDYKDQDSINLIPDKKIAITFRHPIESADGADDGTIAYGTTITSAEITVYNDDFSKNITTDIIDGTAQLLVNEVTVVFKYPVENGVGRYKAIIKLDVSNGDVLPLRYYRIYVVGLSSN